MKTMQVPFVANMAEFNSLPWENVDNNNWSDFAKAPATKVKVARNADGLIVMFEVAEANPRAVNTEDDAPVYEDSCVEFFCQVPGADRYQNYEFNSLGKLLASTRAGRKEAVVPRTAEELAKVKRTVNVGPDSWTLIAEIPYELIGIDKDSKELRTNMYKCGDKTDHPHFASWNAIDAPAPNFHLPEFFGQAQLV